MFDPSDESGLDDDNEDALSEHHVSFVPETAFERRIYANYSTSIRWLAVRPALLRLREDRARSESPDDDPSLVQRKDEIMFLAGAMNSLEIQVSRATLREKINKRENAESKVLKREQAIRTSVEKKRREKTAELRRLRKEEQQQAKVQEASQREADAWKIIRARNLKRVANAKLAAEAKRRKNEASRAASPSKYGIPDEALTRSLDRWRSKQKPKPSGVVRIPSPLPPAIPLPPRPKRSPPPLSPVPSSGYRIKKRSFDARPEIIVGGPGARFS